MIPLEQIFKENGISYPEHSIFYDLAIKSFKEWLQQKQKRAKIISTDPVQKSNNIQFWKGRKSAFDELLEELQQ